MASLVNVEVPIPKKATLNTVQPQKLRIFYGSQRGALYLTRSNTMSPKVLENCIRSVLKLDDPSLSSCSLVGIIEHTEQDDDDPAGLIPLEILCENSDIINPDHWYTLQFWNTAPPTTTELPPPVPNRPENSVQEENNNWGYYGDPWQNEEYFGQYGKITIHGEMLKDEYRTKTYLEAIQKHAIDFKDKVVMDVGTGTSVLACFCAKAGAKKVYAVEASKLAEYSQMIVNANGLDNVIEIINSRVEDVTIPEKVDIIISEWMGTFLIFESMLESVLFARDKFLKEDGIMFPSHGSIYLAPLTMEQFYKEKIAFWNNVYDLDMSVLVPLAKKTAFEKPIIDKPVKEENVLAEPFLVTSFDLKTVGPTEPYDKTSVNFVFKAKKTAKMHGFVTWFDVEFSGKTNKDVIILNTSPSHPDTHWHQQLFFFEDPIQVEEGQTLKGLITYQRNPELLRHLIIDISFIVVETAEGRSKKFYLWGPES